MKSVISAINIHQKASAFVKVFYQAGLNVSITAKKAIKRLEKAIAQGERKEQK